MDIDTYIMIVKDVKRKKIKMFPPLPCRIVNSSKHNIPKS